MGRLAALPAIVWSLPHLRVLDASDNQLTAVPQEAAAAPSLQSLDLRGNTIVSGSVPQALRIALGRRLVLGPLGSGEDEGQVTAP